MFEDDFGDLGIGDGALRRLPSQEECTGALEELYTAVGHYYHEEALFYWYSASLIWNDFLWQRSHRWCQRLCRGWTIGRAWRHINLLYRHNTTAEQILSPLKFNQLHLTIVMPLHCGGAGSNVSPKAHSNIRAWRVCTILYFLSATSCSGLRS